MYALSFFLKRKDAKHQQIKRGGLTLEFYLFECLNHSNVTFGMYQANSIDFKIEYQYKVK